LSTFAIRHELSSAQPRLCTTDTHPEEDTDSLGWHCTETPAVLKSQIGGNQRESAEPIKGSKLSPRQPRGHIQVNLSADLTRVPSGIELG
jgi:hypothetical protein